MANSQSFRQCSTGALTNVAKLAIVEDKPIMFDYLTNSLEGSVIIGIKESGDKLLVKSEDEYTSPIKKFTKLKKNILL